VVVCMHKIFAASTNNKKLTTIFASPEMDFRRGVQTLQSITQPFCVCVCESVCVCMCVFVCDCVYAYASVCVYVCVYKRRNRTLSILHICMYIYMHVTISLYAHVQTYKEIEI